MKNLLARLPRPTLAAILLIPLLLLIDALCYQVTLPVEIIEQQGTMTLIVGSTHLAVGSFAQPQSLQFVPYDPLLHEYQLDGSDSVYNRDLDTAYLQQIAASPYYRLQSWMRDLDGTSRWRDLEIEASGRVLNRMAWPANGALVALPDTTHFQLRVQLQRPETPMALDLILHDGSTLQILLDRGNRQITVSATSQGITNTVASAFFPVDTAPFAAMLVDTLARIVLWATLILLAVQICELAAGCGLALIHQTALRRKEEEKRQFRREVFSHITSLARLWTQQFARCFRALHPIAWLALGCSLAYVIWIARVEFAGQPHIYDASAYFFNAKIYAGGQLSAPTPPSSTSFPGPFMLIFHGRWFSQYEPGTALTLVPGIWLGMPWLVEPVLGTLALLGIGLIAARLYNRRVATLAVLLGCLSPFYSYLAASYLSHTIALFYLVWGLWAFLRFRQGGAGWNMLLCGCCFGMAVLTRDLVALLYIALLLPGVVLLTWQKSKSKGKRLRLRRWQWWLVLLAIALLSCFLYLGNNFLLTGDMLTTPRNLFFAGDTWGFGQDIGFYGQHTLAAGMVNLDQLLTSLQIDLFGWPFYFTLAFLALPFLTSLPFRFTRKSRSKTRSLSQTGPLLLPAAQATDSPKTHTIQAHKADWLLLTVLVLTVGSYVGYFYNGIYLGPRYLFEDLPFLLILSSRGILTLDAWGLKSRQAASNWLQRPAKLATRPTRPIFSLMTLLLVSILVLCNLLYYLPRQAERYQHFTGLPDLMPLATSQIYQSPVHHALVVTDDLAVYQLILFPLNDPQLKGDVIYAWGYTTAQFQELRRAFPDRTLYLLVIEADGSIRYIPLK